MNTHLTSSPISRYASTQITASGAAVTDRTRPAAGETGLSPVVHERPRLTLVSPPAWSHKLILTGSLNRRSALELEDEIECLCQEGVTTLTLDLRQLDAIDADGITAIASRGAACRQQDRKLTVISDSHHSARAGRGGHPGAAELRAVRDRRSGLRRFRLQRFRGKLARGQVDHDDQAPMSGAEPMSRAG